MERPFGTPASPAGNFLARERVRDMARRARSTVSGKFVKKSKAEANPDTTIMESRKKRTGNRTVARSAITGRFVSMATAEEQPDTTVIQKL